MHFAGCRAASAQIPWRVILTGQNCPIGPSRMQFSVAVDHAVVSVEPLQFYAGWRQTEEAYSAVH